MKDKNLELSGVFMAIMFLFLLVGTSIFRGVTYDIMAVLGFVSMFVSVVFWCRYCLPRMGKRFL